jgi:hypothetical protein
MRNTLRTAALAAVLLTAGCSTANGPTFPAKPVIAYAPAADLTTENAASITGSKIENANVLVGDVRVYVTHIDSEPTQRSGTDQDQVLLVKPGTRYVRMVLTRRDFWNGRSFHACAEQFIELTAGKVYVARGELKGRAANLWLDEMGSTNEQARATAGVSITDRVTIGYTNIPIVKAAHPCAL